LRFAVVSRFHIRHGSTPTWTRSAYWDSVFTTFARLWSKDSGSALSSYPAVGTLAGAIDARLKLAVER
jgi:hypothetical protein